MSKKWNFNELRENLSHVISESSKKPQTILDVDGSEKAVILGIEDWKSLSLRKYWSEIEDFKAVLKKEDDPSENILRISYEAC